MFKEEFVDEAIEKGPEIIIYMLIDQIGAFSWRMNHDMADGRIPEHEHDAIDRNLEKSREQQTRLVRCLPKFGVTRPLDENDRPTDEYWKWYRWWRKWHKDDLTDEQWREIDGSIGMEMTEEQIARCRPEGTWNE